MWEQTTHTRTSTSGPSRSGMVRDPGAEMVYCSARPSRTWWAASSPARPGATCPRCSTKLIARPLEIKRQYLPMSPTGDRHDDAAARGFLPRDFLKLAQVHLNGGTWKGHRVYAGGGGRGARRRATTSRRLAVSWKYGYLWWVTDHPYQGRFDPRVLRERQRRPDIRWAYPGSISRSFSMPACTATWAAARPRASTCPSSSCLRWRTSRRVRPRGKWRAVADARLRSVTPP